MAKGHVQKLIVFFLTLDSVCIINWINLNLHSILELLLAHCKVWTMLLNSSIFYLKVYFSRLSFWTLLSHSLRRWDTFLFHLLLKCCMHLNLICLLHFEIVSLLRPGGGFNKAGNSWLAKDRDLAILPAAGVGNPNSHSLAIPLTIGSRLDFFEWLHFEIVYSLM